MKVNISKSIFFNYYIMCKYFRVMFKVESIVLDAHLCWRCSPSSRHEVQMLRTK